MDKIEKAPQVTAEKMIHRLIDGGKEESKNPPTLQNKQAVAPTLYVATLLLVNKQRDRKGRAVLCSRFFLGLGSPRALRS